MSRLSSHITTVIVALFLANPTVHGQDKQDDFPRPSRSVAFPPTSKTSAARQPKSVGATSKTRVVPQITDPVLELYDFFQEIGNLSRYRRHLNLLEQYQFSPTPEQSIEIARILQRLDPHMRAARRGIQLSQDRQWRIRGVEKQVFDLLVNGKLPKEAWADWKIITSESDTKVFSIFLSHWDFREVPNGGRRREESEPLAQARRRLLNHELTVADLFRLWTAAMAANESLFLCEKKQRSLDRLCNLLSENTLRRFTESPNDVPEHGHAFALVQSEPKLLDDDSYRKMIDEEERFDDAGVTEDDLKDYDDALKLRFAYRPDCRTMVERLLALNLSAKDFGTYRRLVENCYPIEDDSKKRLVGYRPRERQGRGQGFQLPRDGVRASSRLLAGPRDEFGRRIDSLKRADTLKHIEKMNEWRQELGQISDIAKDAAFLEGHLGQDAKRFFKTTAR